MARSSFIDVVLDPSGNVVANATVDVFEPGTTSSIAETIFAARTGGSTLSLPLTTDALGKVEFWLDTPKRVDLRISGTGITTTTRTVDLHPSGDQGPLGVLGYAEAVADQGSITTEIDLTGLTTTVTVGEDRRVKITAKVNAESTAVSRIDLFTKESTTYLQTGTVATVASIPETIEVSTILTPSAGSHTYKLTLLETGAGTVTMRASTTNPAYILVEDIGTTQAVE